MKKRYELSIHTNMSISDGVSSLDEYYEYAKENLEGFAIVDRNGIFSFPYIKQDVKTLFGASLDMIDETLYNITLNPGKANLKASDYVVFDLETTGITYDAEIIEIGAVKVRNGKIIDSFLERVQPKRSISQKSQEITGITLDDLKDCQTIEEVMPRFLEFLGNSILVAHNASFDYSHIFNYLPRRFMVIDTLQLARTLYTRMTKKFHLGALCELFNISLDQAHNALCDASATAKLFIRMLKDLDARGINRYEEINSIIDKREMWKYTHPYPISVLVKNDQGYENLLEIINDGLNKHFYGDARYLKSIISKYRDGLLIGSGSFLGPLFQYSYEKNDEELKKEMMFFDYIEINHSDSYRNYQEILGDNYLDVIHNGIKRIVSIANELGKLVVATSNAYYVSKNQYAVYENLIKNGNTKRFNTLSRFMNIPFAHIKSGQEFENDLSYLDDSLSIIYDNTCKIANMISFNGKKLKKYPLKSINNSALASYELIIDYALGKAKQNHFINDGFLFSADGKKYFIKTLKDIVGGNRFIIPSEYSYIDNVHTKTTHIPNKYCLIPSEINPLWISPLQYEICENRENQKITHLPYEYYKDYVETIVIEESSYFSLLEKLRAIPSKISSVSLLKESAVYHNISLKEEYLLELAWYRCYRPLFFFKNYLDIIGIDDFIKEEISNEGFNILEPSLEKSACSEYIIDNKSLIMPLECALNDTAQLVYESNAQWPLENAEDCIARFGEEVYNKYQESFIKLLEGNKC